MLLQFSTFHYLMTICKCCMKLRYIFRQQQYKGQNMRERERERVRRREGESRIEDNNEK